MIFALIAFLALGPRPGGAAPADPLGLPFYEQQLQLALPAGGRPVTVTVAPLYRDAKWAVTQRWDDNRVDSLRVRDLLKRYHMRGTFYLNGSDTWYFNEAGYRFEGDPSKDLAKALRQGGHSIGGHSLTHSFMPLLNRQEQFYELLGVRIDREVNSQSPVSSFVFPFTVFRNALEADAVHQDLAEALRRSGYLHVANQYFNIRAKQPTGLLDSWLLPCDGKPIDGVLKLYLMGSEKQRERSGNFCFCMHAWPGSWGGAGLPQLAAALKRWADRRSWWYANQNELAAYRYQLQHGSMSYAVEGADLKLSVRRFEPWALGDAVPLTLRLQGYIDAPQASFEGVSLTPRRARDKGVWLLDLPQSSGHGLPELYDWHRNHGNLVKGYDEKGKGVITGLGSRLSFDGNILHFALKNKEELTDIKLSWRVPLGWQAPDTQSLERLSAGQGLQVEAALPDASNPLLAQGRPYFAVQVDALRKGQRIRLYSDCRAEALSRDPQFPKGGFLVLGPLPGDRVDFDVNRFADKTLKQQRPSRCQTVFKEVEACWEALPESRLDPLHPELIPAGAMSAPRTFYTWDPSLYYTHGHRLHYLMGGVIESPTSRMATAYFPAQVKRLYLNGKRVRGKKLQLQAGSNLLTLLYRPGVKDDDGQGSFSERNYGPFFRLVDEKGERLRDIQYQRPDWLDEAPKNSDPI